jgi:NAD(P)H-dependent flavin oxidoreductase YrpB (nitropropane dioxygenase family)
LAELIYVEEPTLRLPTIIQGGMGVGVSSWQLARAVAHAGQLGVVSGTAVAVTTARRLALGDPDGHFTRALAQFPDPAMAERVRAQWMGKAGARVGDRFPSVPRPTLDPSPAVVELTIVASFAEVYLAKEGHDGLVGVNYLEKIQLPTLPSIYGAMLAGVDVVLMGAGVPARIPAVIDALTEHREVRLPVDVTGAESGARYETVLAPRDVLGVEPPELDRPAFLAIVSSATLARYLARNASGSPDGFVVETSVAGGHNAPPRGWNSSAGTPPVYGPRDDLDLEAIDAIGLPFWLAGGYATPGGLADAQAHGAVGVQIGTAFAFCEESGLDDGFKRRVLAESRAGRVKVRTDGAASPTGFPFKLLELADTMSEPEVYDERRRRCDLGYLREMYQRDDGRVGYRCSAEPVDAYVRKGGDPAQTVGRQCLCNSLVANIGLGQRRHDGYEEAPLLTAGDAAAEIAGLVGPGRDSYTAGDVIAQVLGEA